MKLATFGACAALFALPTVALAQWSDNFESYAPGLLLPQSDWESWNFDPNAGNADVVSSPALGLRSLGNTGDPTFAMADDTVHQYSGYNSGVWIYSVEQYIPTAMTGEAYFILLNTYDGLDPTSGSYNWSTQIAMNAVDGLIRDDGSGNTLALVTNAWVELKIVIDLVNDRQDIFYGGNLLSSNSWSGGLSGGGVLNIAAVDLWGNDASAHYYDNMKIELAPPDGACCFNDGSCTLENSSTACETGGGDFQGLGSACAAVECPVLGPNGWVVEGPFSWSGNLCDEADDCPLTSGNDIQFEVTIPWASDWTFSVCGAAFDSVMALGTAACAPDLAYNDDSPECGDLTSQFTVALTPGTYYLSLHGFSSGDCGAYTLEVTSGACALTQPGGSILEGEACGDNTNGGCNDAAGGYPFDTINLGDTIWGTVFHLGSSRDTDWRKLTLAAPTTVRYAGQFEGISGGALYRVASTTGDCLGSLTVPNAVNDSNPCATGEVSFEVALPAGEHWFWAGPLPAPGVTVPPQIECGTFDNYYVTLTAVKVPCPLDLDNSGDVGFSDVLLVLSAWGNLGGPEDLDNSGDVGFNDLLLILSAWGPCP